MTITKITAGRFAGKYRIRVQPVDRITGRRYSLPTKYATTKRAAEKIERQLWAKAESDYDSVTAKMNFARCFDRYVEDEFRSGRWENATYRAWKYSSNIFKEYFPNAQMKDLNQRVVRDFARRFVKDHKLSINENSVVVRRLTHMRSYFSHYIGSIYRENPVPEHAMSRFFKLEEMTAERQRYVLSDNEIKQLIAEIERGLNFAEPYRCISRLAIYIDLMTGMRPQELQALTWDAITQENGNFVFKLSDSWNEHDYRLNGHLKSRKRGIVRTSLPFTPRLNEYLMQFKEAQEKFLKKRHLTNPNNFIFLNLNDYKKCALGYPVTQTSLNQMLHKLGQDIGLETGQKTWTMYSLRHTVATKLGNMPGISYPWAAERLGHSLSEFTRTYVHCDRDINEEMSKMWLPGD